MPTVSVDIPNAAYPIVIEPGIVDRVGMHLRNLKTARKACVVSDMNVAPRYLQRLIASLEAAGFETIPHIIMAGEGFKTFATVADIYNTFLPRRIDRHTPVIALGGGVVGDIAGFVAATILRGVPFVQVPTTLLAMVDASVGGKTGIDHAVGKNLIGAFHQPRAVLVDPEVLRTLPARELRSGLAECIKHDIIRDAQSFATLKDRLPLILSLDMSILGELIAHNVAIKAHVVAADPFERGERAHLNFGHTFGHAIETVSNFEYAHGEAIALGMAAASHLAVQLGMMDRSADEQIRQTIAAAGLPISGLKLDIETVAQSMHFDKKVASGKLRLILPDRIGHVVIREDVDPSKVKAALESLK